MARKKRVVRRRRVTRSAPRRRSTRKKDNLGATILLSGLYGAAREKLDSLAAPITEKIPLGAYSSEAVLGVAGYFAAKGKFGNNKMIKEFGKSALVVESARVGQQMVTSGLPTFTTQGSVSVSNGDSNLIA